MFQEVTKDSFSGLKRLEILEMSGLGSLERLEPPRGLSGLRTLGLDTGPSMETFLAPLQALTSLNLRVTTPRLRQLNSLPPKISHLQFTGSALKEVSNEIRDSNTILCQYSWTLMG